MSRDEKALRKAIVPFSGHAMTSRNTARSSIEKAGYGWKPKLILDYLINFCTRTLRTSK